MANYRSSKVDFVVKSNIQADWHVIQQQYEKLLRKNFFKEIFNITFYDEIEEMIINLKEDLRKVFHISDETVIGREMFPYEKTLALNNNKSEKNNFRKDIWYFRQDIYQLPEDDKHCQYIQFLDCLNCIREYQLQYLLQTQVSPLQQIHGSLLESMNNIITTIDRLINRYNKIYYFYKMPITKEEDEKIKNCVPITNEEDEKLKNWVIKLQ